MSNISPDLLSVLFYPAIWSAGLSELKNLGGPLQPFFSRGKAENSYFSSCNLTQAPPNTMRGTLIFAGSSCPDITDKICHNLGMARADAELSQFSNGETSVRILTSVREKDVFVVQSGSPKINDTIMELLIMISACKGGSANKITGMFAMTVPLAGETRVAAQEVD